MEEKLTELELLLHAPVGDDHPLAGLEASPIPTQPADIYLLGTSVSSAELAAEKGYPYAFALFINNDPDPARLRLIRTEISLMVAGRRAEDDIGLVRYCVGFRGGSQ